MESNVDDIKKNENIDLINDYFNFDLNDVELYRLKNILEEKITEKDKNLLNDNINSLIDEFVKSPFHNFCFPYL